MAISEIFKPTEIEACHELKQRLGARGEYIAGGTDVLVHLREGKLKAEALIDISSIPALKGIRKDAGKITLGAATTFTEVVNGGFPNEEYAGLVEACRSVGSPQIRNAGTLGGNLANGSPAADSAPPLLALEARAVIGSVEGQRVVPLDVFYTGKGSTVLTEVELLEAVEFDAIPSHGVLVFEKLGLRNALAISRISMALYLEVENGRILKVRAASGSIGLSPMREPELEAFLAGKPLDGDWIEAGMDLFSGLVAQRLAGRSSMPYKKEAIKGVFENAARKALAQLKAKGLA